MGKTTLPDMRRIHTSRGQPVTGGKSLSHKTSRFILGVAGSARKQGNSATLLHRLLDALHAEYRTELLYLADLNLHPCDGCHSCETNGTCRITDDMLTINPKLLKADMILLAAPAYMGGLASRMQMFMERTWPLRKGQMADKAGSYIVTGRRRIGMATGVMEEYFMRLGMIVIPGVVGYAFKPGEIKQDQEALDQTEKLVMDCRHYLSLMAEK